MRSRGHGVRPQPICHRWLPHRWRCGVPPTMRAARCGCSGERGAHVIEVYQPHEVARALPRSTRPPVPIPSDSPRRVINATGGSDWWPWLWRDGDPSTGWPTPLRMLPNAATETSVTGVPAAWKCFGFIANAAASCAPPVEFDSQGERVDEMSMSNVVLRPWAFLTAHEFWVQAFTSALLFGNFVGINIDVDPATGFPRQVMPVH